MKKSRSNLLKGIAALMAAALFFVSCTQDPKPTYEVTFDSNGGTAVETQTVEENGKATKPTDPTKDGYDFDAWYNGETAYDFDTPVTEDLTLKASWTAKVVTYTVTFDSAEGSAVETQTVNANGKATKPTDPTKEGFTFAGWYNGETAYDFETAVTANVSLTAKWTAITYTVTFNSNGGSEVAAVIVEYGNAVTLPTEPTLAGKYFGGWYTDESLTIQYKGETITADTTLYAKWTTDPVYTVTFNPNYDGAAAAETKTAKATKDGNYKVTAATTTRTGYTLEGWYTDKECKTKADFTKAISENTTVYAKWTIITYTVTFDSNGGLAVAAATVDYGGKVTKPADPTKDGYTFDGWYNGETAYDFNTAVKANITLKAKWTAKIVTYKVTFDSDGGSPVAEQTVDSGAKATKPADDPTKANYTFVGWYNGDTEYDFDTAVTAAITLKAKWKKIIKQEISAYTVQTESGNVTGSISLSTLEELAESYDTINFELKNIGDAARNGWGVLCIIAQDTDYGWNKFESDTDLNTDSYGQLSSSSFPAGATINISVDLETLISKMKAVEDKTIQALVLQTSNNAILTGAKLVP